MGKKIVPVLLILIVIPLIGSCSTVEREEGKTTYDETKDMVVDILKTDDGKKALKEILADEELKQELVLDNTVVTQSIENTLVSDKGMEFWKKSFEDPNFVEAYAKSMQKENENLLKNLMKDPEYRGMLIEILHDPELEKEMADLLKSKEYREHLQSVITETLESPLYQAKIEEILIKAASEQNKKEGENEDS